MIKGNQKGKRFTARAKPEYEQKMVDIARTARVVSGGRRFSFRVAVVIGNRNGSVAIGLGKSTDTASAIDKAVRAAKKNILKVPLTKDGSIPHEVEAKYASSRIMIKPAQQGRGLVAGSSVRTVLDLSGVKNANAKIFSRSKNKLNNAKAALKALSQLDNDSNKKV